jgi:pimeloyl-ACP methyl ester carboxylesterase
MMRWAAICLVSLIALLTPAASVAQTPPQVHSEYTMIDGFNVPSTPSDYDKIAFVRYWQDRARPGPWPRAILILVPGFFGGAEDFRYVGERLVTRLPSLQVWAVDRRNNLLENRCGMEVAQIMGNPLLALAYYLSPEPYDLPGCPLHADDESVWGGTGTEFTLSQAEAASLGMLTWGLETSLHDLRLLIAHARRQYPLAKVFLGGHSLGGMTSQIYAAWRFGSTPATTGWHTIDGIVLIDGGVDGPNWSPKLIGQYLFDHTLIDGGMVYWNLPAVGATPLLGSLAEIAGMAASFAPVAESILWDKLSVPFSWPVAGTCPTNKALLGALSDNNYQTTNPDFVLHQGAFSAPIGPCPSDGNRALLHWTDFNQVSPPELASTDLWADTLWRSQATNVVEWYFSIMLNAGIDLASNLDSTATIALIGGATAFELEGHRVFDASKVALPVYAFAANECRARFDWYESVSTSITDFTLVDHSNTDSCPSPAAVPYAHLDPLFAADTGGFTNAFLATLAEWLYAHMPSQ